MCTKLFYLHEYVNVQVYVNDVPHRKFQCQLHCGIEINLNPQLRYYFSSNNPIPHE